jgi:hypothetical protein
LEGNGSKPAEGGGIGEPHPDKIEELDEIGLEEVFGQQPVQSEQIFAGLGGRLKGRGNCTLFKGGPGEDLLK